MLKTGDHDYFQEKLQLLTSVADRLFTLKNTEDAIALLEKALETRFRENPSIMLLLARFLLRVERYDEGLSWLQAAVRLDPAAAPWVWL